jgi:hypothetical protein
MQTASDRFKISSWSARVDLVALFSSSDIKPFYSSPSWITSCYWSKIQNQLGIPLWWHALQTVQKMFLHNRIKLDLDIFQFRTNIRVNKVTKPLVTWRTKSFLTFWETAIFSNVICSLGTVSYLINSLLLCHKTLKNIFCSLLCMNMSGGREEVSLLRVTASAVVQHR